MRENRPDTATTDNPEHAHGKRTHSHAHADIPHGHLLRAICRRPECEGYFTHNIHPGPERNGSESEPQP